MTPLHLVTNDSEDAIAVAVRDGSLLEQLLATAVLNLMGDVKWLNKRVSDLEGRERIP